MSDWNPNLYRQFEKQRTQPARDLVNSLDLKTVRCALDVGCGPGNSTALLAAKWPNAEIIGIDNSPSMIAQALRRVPSAQFALKDATAGLSDLGCFDLVFSNAALQWMPSQHALIGHLYALLNECGALAIQVPHTTNMGIRRAVNETAASDKWQGAFPNDNPPYYHDMTYYYDICTKLSSSFYLWETDYYHVMQNHEAILSWYKSTGLKPYLEQLDDMRNAEFAHDILARIREKYDVQPDGSVLFPYKRQFIVIYKDN